MDRCCDGLRRYGQRQADMDGRQQSRTSHRNPFYTTDTVDDTDFAEIGRDAYAADIWGCNVYSRLFGDTDSSDLYSHLRYNVVD